MKTVFQVILIAAAIGLCYLIYESVETPIRFEKAKKERYDKVTKSLKDIRKAELAYKEVHGEFTSNWDTLISFIETGKLPLVRKIGMLTDSMIAEGIDEKAAIKKGLIIRDTIYVAIIDTLFEKGFNTKNISEIPGTSTKFHLGTNTISTASGVVIPIFEAAAHNNTILADMQDDYKQEIINLNDQSRTNGKYPGLKVGSLEQANNNAGNWE